MFLVSTELLGVYEFTQTFSVFPRVFHTDKSLEFLTVGTEVIRNSEVDIIRKTLLYNN